MSKQNTPTQKSGPTGFSFGKILTPKLRQIINFDAQPSQAGSPADAKKSGLEAYAKKNKLSLPPDFSDLVLECEMELERDEVSIEAVTKLTDLYSQAMAFYEAEGSHKYKYFAKKLQDLMLKPNVKETMVREIAPVKSVQEDKELKRMRLESQVSKVNTEKEAFTLVKTHEYKEKEIKRVLEGDLTNQRDRIQKRLAERKAKAQSRAQSVNYISDEASSTTEEVQQDIDASPKAQQKLIKIEEADEADESRYGTPPRRRNKDGQMIIYFPKGKKSLKKLFLEELKSSAVDNQKITRTHVRRYSENKPPVLAAVTTPVTGTTTKRVGRAQSFSTRNALVHSGLLRKASNNSLENKDGEESKTDSHEQEPRSLSGVGKEDQVENPSVVEHHDKPKSNNTVEETDEEGSKNGSGSKNSVGQEEEETTAVEKVEEIKVEVAQEEEKHVGGGSVIINNEESHEEIPKVHEEANKEEVAQENVQESGEAQVEAAALAQEEVTEEKEIVREAETEVKEEIVAAIIEQQEEKQEENITEAPVGETEAEAQVKQDEKIEEQVTEVAVEQQEEPVQENDEVQAEVTNNVQEPEVAEVTTEEKTEEVEQVEQKEETIGTQEPPKAEEQKTETENINTVEVKEEKVEEASVEKEDTAAAARRRRTDSEIADEEKLKMLRKIDEEHKVLLEEFIGKQTQAKEEAAKQVEEKFAKKLKAMEEDMDDDEKLSMMWQKAVAKINKDKETEVQKVVEELTATQTQETEKYKKKLQQQKMFKLAEME